MSVPKVFYIQVSFWWTSFECFILCVTREDLKIDPREQRIFKMCVNDFVPRLALDHKVVASQCKEKAN